MPITSLYAAILVPLFIVLSWRVISYRRGKRVEIGDGADRELLRRMRVHANFAEYTPLAILLVALAESLDTPALILHGLGVMLVAGRASHAYALSQDPHILNVRVIGMVLTFAVLGLAAAACLLMSLRQLLS